MSIFLRSLFLALLATVSVSRVEAETKLTPLRVGVILPLSGDTGSFGTAFKNGMQLALESLSAEDRAHLQVSFEDDALQSTKSVSAYNKLRASEEIQVAINLSSGTAHALAPIAERQKIPLIAIASDPKVVKGRRYAFNFWVTPDEEARAMLPEALRRGYRKVARVSTIHEGVFAVRDALDRANAGQITFVPDEEYPPDARDFKTFVAKIKQRKDLDAIHPILFPGQLSVFAMQVRSAGITLPIFGWEFFEDVNEVKAAQGALEGSWYVNAKDATGGFNERYLARFPGASLYCAANGYDAVFILLQAAKKSPTSGSVRDELANLKNFGGALGTYSASGDNRFTLAATVKEITKDGFKVLN